MSEDFSRRASAIFGEWCTGDQAEKTRHFKEATNNMNEMWANSPSMTKALHSLLQTMVAQGWTAFESLCQNLYDNTVAEGLSSFAAFTRKERNDEYLGFSSRERIRNSYSYVFKCDKQPIISLLASRDIDALALVRNVLAHKAGVIDQEFMEATTNLPAVAAFRALGEGSEIPITGTWVRALVDPVLTIGTNLLNAVDNWIFAHP